MPCRCIGRVEVLLFFFFHWYYSPLWALACQTVSFHFFLFITNFLHLLTPSTWRSLSTSSFHPFLGLPLCLVPSSRGTALLTYNHGANQGEWSVPLPGCFTPGKDPWFSLCRRLGGSQVHEEDKICSTQWVAKLWTIQCIANRYVYCAVLAPLIATAMGL
jgi:hypothetical protein